MRYSIIIAIYNHKKYLPQIIEAWEKQTYKSFELIFCDDGSNDGTREFFKNKKYKYLRQRHSGNLGKSINQGIKIAKCKFCTFVMGDSYPNPNYLEVLNNYIKPNAVLCGVRQQIEDDMIIDIDYRIKQGIIPANPVLLAKSPYDKITGNGLTVPTQALKEVGGFPELKGYGGDDNILAAKLFAKGLVFFSIPSAIINHFYHGVSYPTKRRLNYVRRQIKKILYSIGG